MRKLTHYLLKLSSKFTLWTLGFAVLLFSLGGCSESSQKNPSQAKASLPSNHMQTESLKPVQLLDESALPVAIRIEYTPQVGTTPKLYWQTKGQGAVRNGMIFIIDKKTGKGSAILLPDSPPANIGELSSGTYDVYISELDPFKGGHQVSNTVMVVIK